MLELIGGKLVGMLIAGAGALVVLIGAYFKGRSAGARKEIDRQRRERDKTDAKIDAVEDAVAGRTADENRERLKGWSEKD